jgi:hypothetical protein
VTSGDSNLAAELGAMGMALARQGGFSAAHNCHSIDPLGLSFFL